MIESIRIDNFGACNGQRRIDFTPKINVIESEDSSVGKTQLLKAVYCLYGTPFLESLPSYYQGKREDTEKQLKIDLPKRICQVFMPRGNQLNALFNKREISGPPVTDQKSILEMELSIGEDDEQKFLCASFGPNSRKLQVHTTIAGEDLVKQKAIFVPSREILSFMKGFISLYQFREVSFDRTYYDMALLMESPPLRQEKIPEKIKELMAEIKKLCGGYFVFPGSGIVEFVENETETLYSANVMGESICQLGIFYRLLETGSIPNGKHPLLLDAPGTNFSPQQTELLARILYTLTQEFNQQIIVTAKLYDDLWNRLQNQYEAVNTAQIIAANANNAQVDTTQQALDNPITQTILWP